MQQNRHPKTRRLSKPDVPGYHGAHHNKVADMIEFGTDFILNRTRKLQPRIVHGEKYRNIEIRVISRTNSRDRFDHERQPLQGEIFRLHRNQNGIRRRERSDREGAKSRRRVKKNKIIFG